MTAGAHAASGVIFAILEFTQFDEQVATSAGPECSDALRAITAALEDAYPAVKSRFDADSLTVKGDFFYLMADTMAEAVQYGHKDTLCDAVLPAYKSGGDVLSAFVNFYHTSGGSTDGYDSNVLADPSKGGNGRSWWWQKCTEVAWWQVAPSSGSIRSQAVDMAYHQDLCNRVFGLTTLPDVNGTNNYYGGLDIGGSNIYFSQGVQDPWQWAGMRATPRPSMPTTVVDCDGCAHCVDLYTPTATDSESLVKEREAVKASYTAWIQEAQASGWTVPV
jgi:hypothetical protein